MKKKKKRRNKAHHYTPANEKGLLLPKLEKHWKILIISMLILLALLILSGFFLDADKIWKPLFQK